MIIMGESLGDPGLGVRAMKVGAVDFLEMPYEQEVLLGMVALALADIRETAERNGEAVLARARVAGMPSRDGGAGGVARRGHQQDDRQGPWDRPAHGGDPPRPCHGPARRRTLPEAVLTAAAAGLRPPR